MISILEYKGERKTVIVSEKMVQLSKWIEKEANRDKPTVTDEEYSHEYTKLQDYYESKAIKLFGSTDIYMECFMQQDDLMKEDEILDYAKFIDWYD